MRSIRLTVIALAAVAAAVAVVGSPAGSQEGPPPIPVQCEGLDLDPTSGPEGTVVSVSGDLRSDCGPIGLSGAEGLGGLECSGLVTHPDIDPIAFPLDADGPELEGTFTAPTVTPPSPTVDTELLLDVDVTCNLFLPPPPPPSPEGDLVEVFVYDTEVFTLQIPGVDVPTAVPDVDADVVTATPTFTG
jgi:hypothetical protein